MSEHERETAFLRRVLLYNDCDEHRKLDKSMAQVQRDERCVQRMAWTMVLFLMLAMTPAAFGAILQANFPYNAPQPVIDVFCAFVLAALICLLGFGALLTVYRGRLNRMREESRQLVTRFLESRMGKAHTPELPGNDPVFHDDGTFQSAVVESLRYNY